MPGILNFKFFLKTRKAAFKKADKTFHVHFLSRNKKRTKEMRPLLSFM